MKSTSSGQKEQVNLRVFDVSDLDLEDVPHRLGLIKGPGSVCCHGKSGRTRWCGPVTTLNDREQSKRGTPALLAKTV